MISGDLFLGCGSLLAPNSGAWMAKPAEIPDLVTDLVDLSKEYLRQETVEPARRLGRAAGLGLLAAVLIATGLVLLLIAGLRWAIELLPDTEWWSTVAYGGAAVVGLIVAALFMWRASR